MNRSITPPPIPYLKHKATALRKKFLASNQSLSHSGALEMIAHQYGYRDWNTLSAASKKQQRLVIKGQRVSGRYLGKAFQGIVKDVTTLPDTNNSRVTIIFDDPVDVVSFNSFSNYRKQVSCILTPKAMTTEKTSNGSPHMVLDL